MAGNAYAEDKFNMTQSLEEYIRQARASQIPLQTSEGSLYSRSGINSELFTDIKAKRVNDIVTIRILESTQAQSAADAQTNRSSSVSLGIQNLFGAENHTSVLQNMLTANSDLQFQGEGSTNRSGSVDALLSARVREVLPNGDMVIEGVKLVSSEQKISVPATLSFRRLSQTCSCRSMARASSAITSGVDGLSESLRRPGRSNGVEWTMKYLKQSLAALLFLACASPEGYSQIRLKDVARWQGVRDNQLVGYGLVVGLNKTGDRRQTMFSTQSLISMLDRMGITLQNNDIRVENIAAVMVTATLSPFARTGSRLDVTVSSIGDARSLQGGILVQTPLKAANGEVYAVGQGPVAIGGFTAGDSLNGVQINHPTTGKVVNGAIVEREVETDLLGRSQLALVLDESDFTTANRVQTAINEKLGPGAARSIDGRTIAVAVPDVFRGRTIDLIADLENVQIMTDQKAKVVLNERTGTVVIGKDVRISSVAITQGSLAIQIGTTFNVSQPPPFSKGDTVVVPQQEVTAGETRKNLVMIPDSANVEDLVRALNGLGVTPKEMVSIFQALKAAGALQAELELL
jgi:flagellar P-ring protein precursor FlgI